MKPEDRLGHAARQKALARRMVQFAAYIQRCVCADALSVEPNEDGTITVRATWPGGSYAKTYTLDDLYRTCWTRRRIIGDILEARGVRA